MTVICRAGAPLRSTAVGKVLFRSSPWFRPHNKTPLIGGGPAPPPPSDSTPPGTYAKSIGMVHCGPVTLSPLGWKNYCLRGGGGFFSKEDDAFPSRLFICSLELFLSVTLHSQYLEAEPTVSKRLPTAYNSPFFLGQPASLEIPTQFGFAN